MKEFYTKISFSFLCICLFLSGCGQNDNLFKQINSNISSARYSFLEQENLNYSIFNGILDKSFAKKGIVQTTINTKSQISSHVVLADGSVIAGGFSILNNGTSVFTLAKYNKDGSLSSSFGTGGIVQTAIGGEAAINALVAMPDGSIIAGGYSKNCANNSLFTLVKYKPDGRINPTFGSRGIVQTLIGNSTSMIRSLTLLNDGNILAAGYSLQDDKSPIMTLAKYNGYGTLVEEFGDDGIVLTQSGLSSQFFTAITLPDNSIVAGGYVNIDLFTKVYALAKYNSLGKLDSSFGANGVSLTPIGMASYVLSLAVSADGALIAGGYSEGVERISFFTIAKFDNKGNLQSNFGENGLILNQIIPNSNRSAYTCSVIVLPEGAILAGGYATGPDISSVFTMYKYDLNGNVHNNFGNNGMVQTKIGNYSYLQSLSLQKDGTVVASGYAEKLGRVAFALARYK
ncbi:delta-60 repeat domain-containing protein [Fluviispira vulneris]|uniref:delta-60 repeat domain-containing protein n=1 Tax=Fluviispira vulneris TaxID=2763012 RepID=UPI001645184C|nr:delta-60 repeat domain-containing protein [Fluviispira vulneris]